MYFFPAKKIFLLKKKEVKQGTLHISVKKFFFFFLKIFYFMCLELRIYSTLIPCKYSLMYSLVETVLYCLLKLFLFNFPQNCVWNISVLGVPKTGGHKLLGLWLLTDSPEKLIFFIVLKKK